MQAAHTLAVRMLHARTLPLVLAWGEADRQAVVLVPGPGSGRLVVGWGV